MKLFGLIGNGNIAKYHRAAIKKYNADLIAIYDPNITFGTMPALNSDFFEHLDFCRKQWPVREQM